MADSTSGYRNIVVGILIGLLVLAFALWGSEDMFSPQSGNSVLTIGDEEVLSGEFKQIYDQEFAAEVERTGRSYVGDDAFARRLGTQVLGQLLGRKAMLVDATDLGIGYNARSAREELSQVEMFKDPLTGEYSAAQAKSILRDPDGYEAALISDKRLSQTQPAIISGIVPPPAYAEIRYNFLLETRNATVLTLSDKAVPTPEEPTDEELQTFIDDNIIQFTLPEFRRVTMVRMEPTDFRYMDDTALYGLESEEKARSAYNNIFVSEKEIDEQYEVKITSEDLLKPAKRSLTIFVGENEDAANQIAEKLNEGLTDEEVVTLLGLNAPISYEEVLTEEIIDPKVAEAAFEMKDGDIKTVLSGLSEWTTIKITGAIEEFKPPRETVEEEIVDTVVDLNRRNEILDRLDLIQQEIEDGRTLEEAAQIVGVPFTSLPFINRFGATQDELTLNGSARLPGVASDDEILKFIFTANRQIEVDAFDTSTDGRAIIRVDDIIEQRPQDFEDAKPRATAMWKQEQIENAQQELAQSITDRVIAGENLAEIAAEIGDGAVMGNYTLMRSRREEGLGSQVWAGIIEGENGDVTNGLGPRPQTRQIAMLDEIIPNQEPIPAEQKQLEEYRITSQIANDIMLAYQTAITKEHPYHENQARINQVLGLATPPQ